MEPYGIAAANMRAIVYCFCIDSVQWIDAGMLTRVDSKAGQNGPLLLQQRSTLQLPCPICETICS